MVVARDWGEGEMGSYYLRDTDVVTWTREPASCSMKDSRILRKEGEETPTGTSAPFLRGCHFCELLPLFTWLSVHHSGISGFCWEDDRVAASQYVSLEGEGIRLAN